MDRQKNDSYIGKVFNDAILVLSYEYEDEECKKPLFKCKCLRCGSICYKHKGSFHKHGAKSCGCLQREKASAIGKKTGSVNIWSARKTTFRKWHGAWKDGKAVPIYINWRNMMSRCYSENDICYKTYGEKGIEVCTEWQNFESFKEYALQHGYRDHYRTHRLNNDLGYYPENVMFLDKVTHDKLTQYMKKLKVHYLSKEEVEKFISGLG